MNIVFRPTKSLVKAAKYTLSNMGSYYKRYDVDWGVNQIIDKTKDLDNFDIYFGETIVGVVRLQYEGDCCYLRDLQIIPSYQNKGIGQAALSEVKRIASGLKLRKVQLKVFKISPAVSLYKRNGFATESEDERFFIMVFEDILS